MKTLRHSPSLLVFAISTTLCLVIVNALPNLRIQVNNENLQSPPYLLDDASLNQTNNKSASSSLEQAASTSSSTLTNQSSPTTPTSRIQASSPNETELDDEESAPTAGPSISGGGGGGGDDDDDDAAESNGASSFSVIKEETIEEMLDLEPESVVKSAPVSSARPAMDGDYRPFGSGQASAGPESSSLTGGESNSNHNNHNLNEPLVLQPPHDSVASINRKPVQLAVANSHLKKPASIIGDSDDGSSGQTTSAAAAVVAALPHESEPQKKATGAKSLVVLAVLKEAAPDDGAIVTNMGTAKQLKRKTTHENPPDVWEPSQVMSGVSNASLVPAVVNRDYGTQTRTRITLGGGYVRDRLPPLGSSAAPSADSKPLEVVSPSLSSSSSSAMVGAKLVSSSISSGNLDNLSTERIVQPATAAASGQTAARDKTLAGLASNAATNATTAAPLGRQQRLDSRCPKMGVKTFEHPSACDKYYYCEDGYLSEQSCPNGLLYGIRETVVDFCVHRWKATCDDRAIPNPISSPGCRWQYGIFSVQGSPKCTPDYYECIEGRFEVRKCSTDGQVYDDRTKSCQFAEAVGCAQETLGEFQCPADDQANTYWPFPRYFYNERALIHCVNDKPELIRCLNGEVVDPEHLHCVPPAKLAAKSAAPAAGVPAERRTTRERKKDTS